MRKSQLLLSALVASSTLVGALAAQTPFIIPASAATTEGGSSTGYPWNVNLAGGHRIQYCYDSSHFTQTSPILIQRIRWRANGSTTGTWTGVTHPNVVIDMSSSTADQAALSTTFATNHGLDRTNVYTGSVTVLPSPASGSTSPNIFYVDVTFSSPFLYDPSKGADLLIDVTLPGQWTNGTSSYSLDAVSTGSLVSRMYSYSSATSPTGSFQANVGPVIEVTAVPATGLWPDFVADQPIGAAPHKVQFTDKTYTSDPGGVKTWAWDFDGDTKVDSTVQNPTWTYQTVNQTAKYDVTLTVTDAATPSGKSLTKKAYITIDPPPVADFDASPRQGSYKPGLPPVVVTFTDKSVGATSWKWDFDGDTIVDSTAQNPVYPYTKGGTFAVTLEVAGVGGQDKITKPAFIEIKDYLGLTTMFTGGNGLSGSAGCFFDIDVKHAPGVWITGFDLSPYTQNTAFDVEIYTTPNTYVGAQTNAAVWTLVATGSGTSAATRDIPNPVDTSDFFLPLGKYGMYVFNKGAGHSYTNGTGSNQNFSTNEIAITLGESMGGLFTGTINSPRVWNGTIKYVTAGWPSLGVYGAGCTGSAGVPTLSPAPGGAPSLGGALKVDLASMPVAGGGAAILFGFDKTKLLGTVPLPLDLTPAGAPGCALLTDLTLSFPVANVGGTGNWTLAIPNNPSFVGIYMTLQGLVIDMGANALNLTFTNGAEGHIGG